MSASHSCSISSNLETNLTVAPSRQWHICIVNSHLPSIKTKETKCFAIQKAEWLVQAGYKVSLVCLETANLEKSVFQFWHAYLSEKSIHLIPFNYQGPPISSLSAAVESYQLLYWMLNHSSEFDLIHLPDTKGLAYYTLLAKQQGWAFQKIQLCLHICSPLMWHKFVHKQWLEHLDELAIDFLQRESARLATLLISVDEIFDWLKKENWLLSAFATTLLYSSIQYTCQETIQRFKLEWLKFHEQIKQAKENVTALNPLSIEYKTQPPLVSVCVTHFNRPHYLKQALASIREQDYPNLEVILVDDASTLPEVHTYLESLAGEFNYKGWQIIRNKTNLFPGAARNKAVSYSHGEYLLFMDDDNYAKSQQISTFIQVAIHTQADILTCAMDVFQGLHPPSKQTSFIHRFLPCGSP